MYIHYRKTKMCLCSIIIVALFLNTALSGTTDMNQQIQNRVGSIQLPSDLFHKFPSIQNNITGLVFTVYINSSLFPAVHITQNRSIRSPVIGALVAGKYQVEALSNPVLVDLTLSHNNDVRKQLRNMKLPHNTVFYILFIG